VNGVCNNTHEATVSQTKACYLVSYDKQETDVIYTDIFVKLDFRGNDISFNATIP